MFIIFKNLNRTFALNKKTNNYKKHSRFFCQSNFLMMQRQCNNNFSRKPKIFSNKQNFHNRNTNSTTENNFDLDFEEEEEEEENEREKQKKRENERENERQKENERKNEKKYYQNSSESKDYAETCLTASFISMFLIRLADRDSSASPEKDRQKDLDSLNNKTFECIKKESGLKKKFKF